jgi:hypothetical protein
MDLLIEFGYGSHVILEVGLETQVLELHMFILQLMQAMHFHHWMLNII